ncbi:MAG TPA: phosphoribosylanthranilate isomerase [Candidatus Dormibacteraeota bacterium]
MIVKVCGVRTPEIAETAVEAGADWLGLVIAADSPRHVDDAAACAVRRQVRGRASLVGVMVSPTSSACDEAAQRYGLDAVQVHGEAPLALAWQTSVPIIRAINVRDPGVAFVEGWWPDCLVLLDSAPPDDGDLPGGTGLRVDQVAAAALARHRPLMLAGGLTPHNVAAAIEAVRPQGVDASSGLESTPGVKQAHLVAAFVEAARHAGAGAGLGAGW